MNLIVNGFCNSDQIEIINSIIASHDIEKLVVFSADENGKKLLSDLHTVFVIPEIIQGDYDIDAIHLDPLDKTIIDSMLIYESDIMRMMDRFEVYLKKPMSYDERKKIYFKHLRYWSHFLAHNRIDAFISGNIPHDIYDFVILALCKITNIPTVYFYQGQILDIIHPMVDYKIGTDELPKRYNQLLIDYSYEKKYVFSEFVENTWKEMQRDIAPFYMDKYPLNSYMLTIKSFKNILSSVNKISYLGLQRKWKNYKLRSTYKAISKKPDFDSKYIYFPLHYQPELTSCPLGVGYENQYLIIQMLDYFLPDDYILYVKEHPAQEIFARNYDYYNDILKSTKKVVFVPLETSSFDLMNNAQAVTTITGTAGWEALFRQKPVLVFGHNFYQYAPGVTLITTKEDAKKAIDEIVSHKFVYDEIKLKLFIQAVEDTSIKGYIDLEYQIVSKFNNNITNKNISNFINEFLNKLLC